MAVMALIIFLAMWRRVYYLDTRALAGNTDVLGNYSFSDSTFEPQLLVYVDAADKALIDAETGDAARLTKLMELANLRFTTGATPSDIDYISKTRFLEIGFIETDDTATDNSLIYHTRGTTGESDDILLMVLEDFTATMSYANFDVQITPDDFDPNGDTQHDIPAYDGAVAGKTLRGKHTDDTLEGGGGDDSIYGRAGC